MSEERWEALERVRGHEPRASFVKRALDGALEKALGSAGVAPAAVGTPGDVPGTVASTPPRASNAFDPNAGMGQGPDPVRLAQPKSKASPSIRDTWAR